MTTTPHRSVRALLAATAAGLALAACDLPVDNPSVIDAGSFDPGGDAAALSLSGQTNFFDAYASAVSYSAYLSDELWVGAARQETNDFARRVISAGNIDLNPNVWAPLSLAIASNVRAVDVLGDAPGAASDINLARAAMNAGFALELMGEFFCQGVMLIGPSMTPTETLDSAIVRFQRAITVAGAASGGEAADIVNAARVGMARAYLQQGENDAAAQAAAAVPADFTFDARYVDDLANRGRVGNDVFGSTAGNIQVVPDTYRALDDPRIPFEDLGRKAQDGTLDLFVQTKYDGYGSPIRLASGLEARYIIAEANLESGDDAAALALIAERRDAGGQPPFTGTSTDAILAELMDQRARDFWLEAKHLGDALRNPATTPYVPPSGAPFYKPTQGNFGELTCLPVPNEEIRANPNF